MENWGKKQAKVFINIKKNVLLNCFASMELTMKFEWAAVQFVPSQAMNIF